MEDDYMKKVHLILEGGTGEMVGQTMIHLRDSLALLHKGNEDRLDIYYPTIDSGGAALGSIRRLMGDSTLRSFRDPGAEFGLAEVSEGVREELKRQNREADFRLWDVGTEWFRDQTLLTEEALSFDLSKGYGRNQILGSLVAGLAFDIARGSKADKKVGFESIVNEVIDSNRSDRIYVILAGSAHGGEGVTNLSLHPAKLKEMCVEAAQKEKNLQPQAAEAYVEEILKIGVVMVGAAFKFPKIEGLDQDISGLVAGALQNYPTDSAAALDAFYLLEHDSMPVQAEIPSYGNDQYKHAHAIELAACAALVHFVSMQEEDLENLHRGSATEDLCPLIPHYSLPGNRKTNWKNLRLPAAWREALSARLRYDAMLLFWMRPQLIPGTGQGGVDRIFESEILHKMYGVSKPADLRNRVSIDELEAGVLLPFRNLLERELLFLTWLRDISLTGLDWQSKKLPEKAACADLFPVEMIDLLLRNKPSQFRELGGMTGFDLDSLTACGEGNLYSTRATPDRIRNKIRFRKNGRPLPFMEIIGTLYDLCADKRERREFWHL